MGGLEARLFRRTHQFNAAGTLAILVALAGISTAAAAPPDEAPAEPSPGILVPIIVSSEKPREQTLIDRKVYNVSADLQSATGSVADVLTAIPSIEVDANGVVALRGSTNVLILIDGRPSAQLSGALAGASLQDMPALDIERIEVMTNPPPQFKAEGTGGVINIITRKSHREGLSGTVNAMAGNRHRSLVGTSSSYNTGGLNLSGSFTRREEDRQRQISSDLTVLNPAANTATVGHNFLNEDIRKRIDIIKLGANYAFNERQSLNVSVSGGERSGPRNYLQTAESGLAPGSFTSLSTRDSAGTERSVDSDQRIVFDQKLRSPDEVLSFTLHRSSFFDHQFYNYTNYFTLPPASPSRDILDTVSNQVKTEFSADYVLPLSKTRNLKVGYDLEKDDNSYGNSGANIDPVTGGQIVNPNITDNFRYLQQVDAAYASYEASAGVWNWLGGLRFERTRTDARQLTNSLSTNRIYMGVYPSLHIDRALSDEATLSFSASRRISRPDPGSLNPYVDQRDVQNLRAGNPNLLPQDTQSYELGYSVDKEHRSYAVTGYFRRSRDKVTDLTQVLPGDVLLTTKENLPTSNSAGLELTSSGQLTKKISYGLSGNLFYTQIDATALGAPGLQSTVGLNGKTNLDYHPTDADTAQIAFTRSAKRLTPQGYVAPINQVNLGYKRQLAGDLAGILTVSDLLNSQTYQRYVNTVVLSDVYQRHIVGRVVYVGLIYSFGSKKKGKESKFDYGEPPE